MDVHLCICSLDTVALVGDARSLEEFRALILRNSGSLSYHRLNSYESTYYVPTGIWVSCGFKGVNPNRIRVELIYGKADALLLRTLLSLLENLRIQRCDIAIDYIGYLIQDYEFHCSRLGLSRHMLSRFPFPHSYAFGAGDSHRRIAVYDRSAKCRADHEVEPHILDVNGEVHRLSLASLQDEGSGWFRIEARLKGGRWILNDTVPRTGVFDDLIVKQRVAVSLGLDLRTEATLEYLSRHPEAMKRLSRNSRPKYRRYLRRLADEHGLVPSPAEVYRDNYISICEVLGGLRNAGCNEEEG